MSTCVVHTLWDQYFSALADGEQPRKGITPNAARSRLRQILARLHVPDAEKYGTHDFRRGHAEARSHGTLWQAFAFFPFCIA